MNIGETISGALFTDENRTYRLALWRIWDRAKDALLFVGLNPSTANDVHDDPTIVKLANYAKDWGYGGLYAGNLFSIVSPYPSVLLTPAAKEQIGGPNDEAIKQMRGLSKTVLVGWGECGKDLGLRITVVLALLGESGLLPESQ